VRESRLSALGESLECPVLTASSFLGPVVFLIRLWESAKGPLVVIAALLAATVLVRSFDHERGCSNQRIKTAHSKMRRFCDVPSCRRV
jgi:hypothetical protein